MADYPLFVVPDHLAEKGRRNWSAKEAEEYKTWLIGAMDERIAHLAARIGEITSDNAEGDLLAMGKEISDVIYDDEFSTRDPIERVLNNRGVALAADMGLAVARLLIDKCGDKIRWQVVRKPKLDISYNLPVLKGSSPRRMDPVGESIARASSILAGRRGPDGWHDMHLFWMKEFM